MCGRYTQLATWSELVQLYRLTSEVTPLNLPAHYNAAPTQLLPVILHPADHDRWLDPSLPAETAQALLAPFAGAMTMLPVASVVNNPRNDDRRCLSPIGEPLTGGGAIDLPETSG